MVFARGTLPCEVLFIGEAPGDSEDILGKPFIGPAGKLLDKIIKESQEYSREYTYAITNLICCIPKGEENDKIEPPEKSVEACRPRLKEFIYKLAKPKLVITVGKYAQKYYATMVSDTTSEAIVHPAFILRAERSSQGLLYQQAMLTLSEAIDSLD